MLAAYGGSARPTRSQIAGFAGSGRGASLRMVLALHAAVVMKLSANYDEFLSKLDHIAPKYGETGLLPGVE